MLILTETLDVRARTIDMELDGEGVIWRSAFDTDERSDSYPEHDRGTALLEIMSDAFKDALQAMHRHVILRNALRKRQNLAQILLLIGIGGGFSDVLPIDDIAAELVKEGAAGDGDLQIVCRWSVDSDGKPVFPHQLGRLMEVKRTIKFEQLQRQMKSLIAMVDECAAEADHKGGTWLRRRLLKL